MKKILTLSLAILLNVPLFSQNTGPMAPEASSFEPVDATDMVNLVTGDLSYVLPLINVPSPEGGFPLALSYHAGISMDQEASWVGLGWNITPGAINRNVNMFPDDNKDAAVIGITSIDPSYYSKYTRGIYLPLEIWGLPSIGLQYSFGSNRSFGGSIGYGKFQFSINSKGGFSVGYKGISAGSEGVGYQMGMDRMGMSSVPIDKNAAMSGSVGFSFDLESGSFNVNASNGISAKGASIGSVSSIGVSLSSNGFSGQYRGVGVSSLALGKLSNGDMSNEIIKNSTYNFLIVNWSNFKVKYWAFKDELDSIYGTLYLGDAYHPGEWSRQMEDYVQDVYSIPVDYSSMSNSSELDCAENLNFPAYDNYAVNVQGLSGSISPALLKTGLLTGNGRTVVAGGDGKLLYYNNYTEWGGRSNVFNNQSKYFYFDNEPVSYATVTSGSYSYTDDITDPSSSSITFNGGELDTKNNAFFNNIYKRKGSAKPVEWFSNDEIRNAESLNKALNGFLESSDIKDRSNLNLFPNNGIGAFTITDIDGKKYYFSLPVYQFEEFARSYPNPEKGDFVEKRNLNTYAYTWLLTAITGPDYVDNGTPGLSPDDNGYFIKFNYGKWTDGYIWQMPYYDMGKEKPYHWGRKQVYYLNSIETRTHTAYFVKNIRKDALGAELYNDFSGAHHYQSKTTPKLYGYYHPKLKRQVILLENTYDYNDNFNTPKHHLSLLLDKIIIVKNSDIVNEITKYGKGIISNENKTGIVGGSFASTKQRSNYYCELDGNDCETYSYPEITYLHGTPFQIYYQDNILEVSDIPTIYEKSKAIKVIKFDYDYSLCKGTPNSDSPEKGKLTLKSVSVYGKNMTSVLPPYVFNYNIKGNNKFDLDKKDNWGYDKVSPENWSLNEVTSPVGSKFSINYESDRYEKEAVYNGIVKSKDVTLPQIEYIRDYTLYNNSIPSPAYSNVYVPVSNWFKVSGSATGLIAGKTYYLNANISAHLHAHYNYNWVADGDIYDHDSNLNCASLQIYDMQITNNTFTGRVYINNYGEAGYIMFRNEKEFDYKSEAQTGFNHLIILESYFKDYGFGKKTKITLYPVISDAKLVYIDSPEQTYGGGLRVSSIAVTNPSTYETQTTLYTYSGGVTTYAPHAFEFYVPYQSELPPPMVYYGDVSVRTIGANTSTGKTQYIFNTPNTATIDFKANDFAMGDQFSVENIQYVKNKSLTLGNNATNLTVRSAKITNNFSNIGSLSQMNTYNASGHLIGKTINTYKTISQIDQGVVQETFQSYKGLADWTDGYVSYPTNYYIVSSSKVNYPTMLESTTVSTVNNTSTVTFDKYDFITGNVLEQTSTGSDGHVYKSVMIPAYQIYENMGPSYDDYTKANMLTQPAVSYNYKNEKLIDASVQTWENAWVYREMDIQNNQYIEDVNNRNIWRKHKTFVWKGEVKPDGSYKDFPSSSYPNTIITNWNTLFNSDGAAGWQKTSEITRYNHYSMPLESKDINGNYAATKMGYNNSYIIASASNASYNSFAYTGFESVENSDWGGEFLGTSGFSNVQGTNAKPAHTGDYYGCLTGTTGPIFTVKFGDDDLMANRTYRAMVWMHKDSPKKAKLVIETKNGETIVKSESRPLESTENKAFGDWILVTQTLDKAYVKPGYTLNTYVAVENGSTLIPVLIDDQRLQPIDAAVTAYTYDDAGNVTAILDNNNFAAKFQYDAAGRLISSFKETPNGFKKVSENRYNYKRSNYLVDYVANISVIMPETPIVFTATNIGVSNNNYTWDFGDGYVGTGREVSHTFVPDASGYFTVKLTCLDPDGKTIMVSKTFSTNYVRLTIPKAEDTYSLDSNLPIEWLSNGISGTFTIKLISTAGQTIVISTNASDSFDFHIPADLTPGTYSLSVTSNDQPGFHSDSGIFTIVRND